MTSGFLRASVLAAFAALGLANLASGQTINLSFSGSGTLSSASGTGTLTPGGSAAISFTIDGNNGNCTSLVQLPITIQVDANDSLNLFFSGQIPASLQNTGGAAASGTVTGTLNVTGGTGTYSGKGGSGTASVPLTLGAKTGSGDSNRPITFTMTGTVTLAGPVVPVANVTPGGIVPVFSDNPVVQPGSWISIYGNNLANAATTWNGNFPTSLGGVSVTIDGNPAYLWFVASSQINLQVPDDSNSGCVPVVVNTPNGSVTTSVQLASISPSFSLYNGTNYAAGVILTPDGTGAYDGGAYDLAGPGNLSFNSRPVHPGETVELFGVGFGPTNPAVPAGQAFSSSAPATNQVSVNICNSSGMGCFQPNVSFAGLVGAGLFQINVQIPNNAPTGTLDVQATVGSGNNAASTSGDINVQLVVQ